MQIDEAQAERLISDIRSQIALRAAQVAIEGGGGGLPPTPPLNRGGGGGTFDPMEPRVAKLEAHMENVRAELGKLSTVPADLATLKERVAHLPSKGFIVGTTLTSMTGIVAALGLLKALGILH
ncbi:hypothetical protein [Sphingomonas sp.]|uniref:hypothetical protein n=1 Tax=Sphingomonas sp. TaxID=28214 RepID=UPI0028A7E9CA|nr:hypothetical protein [Sphingomonas sp.]